jgi:NAD(P)-dependent dehydrogenase (short-subunit alcohol dehydrogenase family)
MKTALITGGAQGLGAAAAERLMAEGFTCFSLLDRNADRLQATVDRLRRAQGSRIRIEAITADLADGAVCQEAVKTTTSVFGRLDLLLNAAGSTERCGMDDTALDVFDRIFAVNARAPFFLMQAAAAQMRNNGGGVMINISSMLAYGGPPNLTTYSASKAALNLMTRSAANTWKRDGIRVFGINLGWTATDGEHVTQTGFHGLSENWAEDIGRRMPFGRMPDSTDIADVIAFLASPAAAMMTGAIIDHEQMPIGVFDQHPALAP